MGSLARKAIGGSIHKIREFELEKVGQILILKQCFIRFLIILMKCY